MIRRSIIVLSAILLVGCLFQTTILNIEGRIFYKGEPAAECIVQFDSSSVYSDITDENGYYRIDGLINGNHDVYIYKNLDSNMCVGLSKKIRIGAHTTALNEIELYEPLKLIEFKRDETKNEKLKLHWHIENKDNIVGYKIISNKNVFLDEANGRVVFESTNPNDSVCYDYGFNDDELSYYQLFTYFKDGKFGKSNIVSITADKVTFLINGNFEEVLNNYYWYAYSTQFQRDSENAYEGNYCLCGTSYPSSEGYMTQAISSRNLISGRTYRFSIMMKSGENATLSTQLTYNAARPNGQRLPTLSLSPSCDWTEKSMDFIMPDLEWNSYFRVELILSSSDTTREGTGWFDDVKFELLDD